MAAIQPVPPPPTTNTLDPAQRTRLLKSTKKLGAILGATPRVLEPGTTLPPPLTPKTRASRREGKLFNSSSASSSMTSLSSSSDEGFVWVSQGSDKQHRKIASTPIAIDLSFSTSDINLPVHKKTKTSLHHAIVPAQQLSQPMLYRLRALPVPPPIVASSYGTPDRHLPEAKANPLSPLSPTFSVEVVAVKPQQQRKRGLTDSDRRRKMAKLARTLGENIPPELVFGPPQRSSSLLGRDARTATATATAAVAPGPVSISTPTGHPSSGRRKRSGTGARRPEGLASKESALPPPPPVPTLPSVSAATKPKPLRTEKPLPLNTSRGFGATSFTSKPLPSPIVTVTTTTTTTTSTTTKNRQRPRSLTLPQVPISEFRGIILEQDQEQQQDAITATRVHPGHARGRAQSRSLDESTRPEVSVAAHAAAAAVSTTDVLLLSPPVDYGRKKERDWSGEWNIRDVQDLMRGLRELRGR